MKLIKELEGEGAEIILLEAEESRVFWSRLWDQPTEENQNAK